jgi:hypothetical protein
MVPWVNDRFSSGSHVMILIMLLAGLLSPVEAEAAGKAQSTRPEYNSPVPPVPPSGDRSNPTDPSHLLILPTIRARDLAFHLSIPQVVEYQAAAQSRNAAGKPVGFVVLRVPPRQGKSEPGPARYILFTNDNDSPRSFIGNDMLANLSTAALGAWRAADGGHPPVVVMYGQGTRQDFDAARLTMEISARSGSSPDYS